MALSCTFCLVTSSWIEKFLIAQDSIWWLLVNAHPHSQELFWPGRPNAWTKCCQRRRQFNASSAVERKHPHEEKTHVQWSTGISNLFLCWQGCHRNKMRVCKNHLGESAGQHWSLCQVLPYSHCLLCVWLAGEVSRPCALILSWMPIWGKAL